MDGLGLVSWRGRKPMWLGLGDAIRLKIAACYPSDGEPERCHVVFTPPPKETLVRPLGFRAFTCGSGCQHDVADTPGPSPIRRTFGLDVRGAGQPGHLR